MFRPGYWLDTVSPPFEEFDGSMVYEKVEAMPDGASLRVKITGPDFDNPDESNHTNLVLDLGGQADAESRFMNAGLMVLQDEEKVVVDGLTWDSKHKQLDKLFFIGDLDNPLIIEKILVERDRMAKEWFYLPAIALLALIILLQRQRIRQHGHPVRVDEE